jgi:hypothetical protein
MLPIMPSTVSLPVQAMPGWLKQGGLGGAVFLLCWGGAIACWRMSGRAPGVTEMLLCLLALPAVLLLLAWGGNKAMTSLRTVPAATSKVQPDPASAAAPPAPPVAILAAAVRSPHGATVDELAEAIAGNRARADLDRELVDEDGFPVVTARSADASDDMLQDDIIEWLSRNDMGELRFTEEQWRALTLASAVTADLAMRAAGERTALASSPPMLQLLPFLPADWQTDQRRAASMWLRHTAAQFGWPFERISVPADTLAIATDAAPTALLKRFAIDAAAGATPALALIVACASHIGQQTVDEWAATGSLFTSAQPQGLIPGEGAVGLLLADLDRAEATESMTYVLLDRIEEVQRDTANDDVRRADTALLCELAERVCKHAAVPLPKVAMIVADAGHRRNPVAELMGFASAALPKLDASEDIVCVGLSSGTCGAVPFLTSLALARHYVLEREGPVLCVSIEAAYRRHVGLVRPVAASG